MDIAAPSNHSSRPHALFVNHAAPVCGLMFLLLPQPALAAAPTEIVSFGIAAGGVALALAASIWAIASSLLLGRAVQSRRALAARAQAALAARDALIGAGRESVVVWGRSSEQPHAYGGGKALLESCLAGEDSAGLTEALDVFAGSGQPFSLTARDMGGEIVHLRGRAVGGFAAVWLDRPAAAAGASPEAHRLLEALPIPIWLRDASLSLAWVNRAYTAAVGAADEAAVLVSQIALEKSERDLASAARSEGHAVEARRFAVVGNQRRAMAITDTPIADGRILGAAIDVTDAMNAEAKLQQHLDAHSDTLDRLATAVAIYGPDQRLSFYNRAFEQLWHLPEDWLDSRPSHGDILDRLREMRRLPEQRDYQAWRRERLALHEQPNAHIPEDLWHLPDGKTLRVVAQPHPFGGLTYLYEDVTEKIALEANYNTLIKAQSATLDTLTEGVAVFGPDGRLRLHNAAFVRLWQFDPPDLGGAPHVQKIAQACVRRFGEEAAWQRLVASITSGSERRREWGELERFDRTIISISLAPLPDDAILVTFTDVTDRSRIESALHERNEALKAADRLKSEFVRHASRMFRDPLNAVQGFAEMLSSGHAGRLNEKQAEYVEHVLAASNQLSLVTGNILDLALIDSGAMQLELAKVDLFDLLTNVVAPLRQHAESLGIAFELNCPDTIGEVVIDPRRIQQVVFNLLSNALKHTPRDGSISVIAELVNDDLQVSVSDSGPGIPADVKASVFEGFVAKGSNTQRGAGLGLALVNRFIEMHGGWVEIDSNEEHGTLVRCHLPRRAVVEAPQTAS
jgi:signal transduction histidine kinase